VEGVETEKDVATGDGDLPLASTLTGWSEVPLPSVMLGPKGLHWGQHGWVLLQLAGLSLASWWKH
jgi:hypothetical protein